MRRWLLLALALTLLIGTNAALAEERNEGTVIVVDDWGAAEDAVSELVEVEPFVPDSMDRAVFGYDGRITVANPSVYPFSAIAYMEMTGACGDTWTGTGFMVSRDRMLTAGHCLRCATHSAWAKTIDFYFGYKNRKNCLYQYIGQWTGWAGNLFEDRQYSTLNDFGCIKLYKNVGDTVGWLGTYWDMPDYSVESSYLYVAGYRDGMLRYDSGMVRAQDATHLTYNIDAVAGNSGGPIFTSDNYAVGIHIAENDAFNIGYRLTTNVKNHMDGLN